MTAKTTRRYVKGSSPPAADMPVPVMQDVIAEDDEEDEDEDFDGPVVVKNRSSSAVIQRIYGTGPGAVKTFLVPSIFIHRPPTVWFDYCKGYAPGREQDRDIIFPFRCRRSHNKLLYRQDKHIHCVSSALRRAGFTRLLKGSSFNVIWAGHLKPKRLQKLQPYQKINHYPGARPAPMAFAHKRLVTLCLRR